MTRRQRLVRALHTSENGFAKVRVEDLRWALTLLVDDGTDVENAGAAFPPDGDEDPDLKADVADLS